MPARLTRAPQAVPLNVERALLHSRGADSPFVPQLRCTRSASRPFESRAITARRATGRGPSSPPLGRSSTIPNLDRPHHVQAGELRPAEGRNPQGSARDSGFPSLRHDVTCASLARRLSDAPAHRPARGRLASRTVGTSRYDALARARSFVERIPQKSYFAVAFLLALNGQA